MPCLFYFILNLILLCRDHWFLIIVCHAGKIVPPEKWTDQDNLSSDIDSVCEVYKSSSLDNSGFDYSYENHYILVNCDQNKEQEATTYRSNVDNIVVETVIVDEKSDLECKPKQNDCSDRSFGLFHNDSVQNQDCTGGEINGSLFFSFFII